jgi:hypothetical protein
MKKFISLLIVLTLLFGGFVGLNQAEADTTDTFTITVTVQFMEMQIVAHDAEWDGTAYTTWALSTMATSATKTMTETEGVKVVLGTTSQTVDIQSHVSDQGAAWTVGSEAAAGVYAIMAKGFAATQATPDVTGGTQLTTEALDVTGATAVEDGADTWLYYDFDSPTSVATGEEQTITITVAIEASS